MGVKEGVVEKRKVAKVTGWQGSDNTTNSHDYFVVPVTPMYPQCALGVPVFNRCTDPRRKSGSVPVGLSSPAFFQEVSSPEEGSSRPLCDLQVQHRKFLGGGVLTGLVVRFLAGC